jgi:hypothetical protein
MKAIPLGRVERQSGQQAQGRYRHSQEPILISIINDLSDLCLILQMFSYESVSGMETLLVLMQVRESDNNGAPGHDKPTGVSHRWPILILVLGLVMTIGWGGFIVWMVLRILHFVWAVQGKRRRFISAWRGSVNSATRPAAIAGGAPSPPILAGRRGAKGCHPARMAFPIHKNAFGWGKSPCGTKGARGAPPARGQLAWAADGPWRAAFGDSGTGGFVCGSHSGWRPRGRRCCCSQFSPE